MALVSTRFQRLPKKTTRNELQYSIGMSQEEEGDWISCGESDLADEDFDGGRPDPDGRYRFGYAGPDPYLFQIAEDTSGNVDGGGSERGRGGRCVSYPEL